jgi:uncharacterized tellurite resistance protein B-like protein
MLDFLKNFLDEVVSGRKVADRFDKDDERLAAAALLIHVSMIDGEMTDAERLRLQNLLQREFSLDSASVTDLIALASAAEREAVDLYSFTSLLNRSLDDAGRRRMVEMMWQMVFADGGMNEFEDNVVWRASDLLGVSARERVELRRAIAAAPEDQGDV